MRGGILLQVTQTGLMICDIASQITQTGLMRCIVLQVTQTGLMSDSEINPTRCNNYVILRNGFTLHFG